MDGTVESDMVEEARRWFAEAAPQINGIIVFAANHGLVYTGPEAPKWMQETEQSGRP